MWRALAQSSARRAPISAAGITKSTTPSATALAGIESNSASDGDCAKVTPPRSLMRRRPSAPSEPMPLSTMPIARSRWTSPSVRRKMSIAVFGPPRRLAGVTRNEPSAIFRSRRGEIT